MNILATARWPVGGIRTFFRYVYGNVAFDNCNFTLLCPDFETANYLGQYFPKGQLVFQSAPTDFFGFMRAVRRSASEGNFDLIHSHGFTASALTEAAILGKKNEPHLMTAHDVFLPGMFSGLRGQIKRKLLASCYSRLSAIHAVTEDAAENFLEYMPSVPRSRVFPILHGVDTELFAQCDTLDIRNSLGLPPDTLLIGFFGRFMPQKGLRILIDAIHEIVKRKLVDQRIRVLTFGWGGYIREDFQYIEELGLERYFIQQPLTDEPGPWMKGVDMVAMPSRWEACGLLAMEALAAGVPLIGTRCIGLREVLAGTPAMTVEPNDVKGFAEAITELIRRPRRSEFSDYQPHAVRRFSVDRAARELRSLCNKVAIARV